MHWDPAVEGNFSSRLHKNLLIVDVGFGFCRLFRSAWTLNLMIMENPVRKYGCMYEFICLLSLRLIFYCGVLLDIYG